MEDLDKVGNHDKVVQAVCKVPLTVVQNKVDCHTKKRITCICSAYGGLHTICLAKVT